MRSVVRTRPRGSVYAEHGPTPVVRLDGDADCPATFFVGQPPRGGADPSIELVADYVPPSADGAFGHRTHRTCRTGLSGRVPLRHAGRLCRRACRRRSRSLPAGINTRPRRSCLELSGYKSVAHHADAVGLVIVTGVVRTLDSQIHSRPVISPLLMRRWEHAKTGSSRVRRLRGHTTVTPVRTGPSPLTSGRSQARWSSA